MGISKETVYRWLEKKKIPAHRVGKQWRFKPSDVDEWVRQGGASQDNLDRFSNLMSGKHKHLGEALYGKRIKVLSTGYDRTLPVTFL